MIHLLSCVICFSLTIKDKNTDEGKVGVGVGGMGGKNLPEICSISSRIMKHRDARQPFIVSPRGLGCDQCQVGSQCCMSRSEMICLDNVYLLLDLDRI